MTVLKPVLSKGVVFRTAFFCGAVAVVGHGILWAAYSAGWNDGGRDPVPWQPVAAITLSVVAIAAFGGFLSATEKIRVAIAASFLLTFVVMTTFAVSIASFADASTDAAKPFIDAFNDVVKVVVGFYFGSEAVVTAAKAYSSAQPDGDAATVNGTDTDLVQNPTDIVVQNR